MDIETPSRKRTARLAGVLYFTWIVTGLYSMFYVPSQINMKDAVSAGQNILAHEFLFRTSILSAIVNSSIWVLMVSVLYRLFKSVGQHQARLLVALVIVQVPTVFIMEAFNITSLMILKGKVLQSYELLQRQDVAMLFLKISDYGVMAVELYWGLWLFPLGTLVYRSGFLPRFIGVWLLINGVAYLVLTSTTLLFPDYQNTVFTIVIPAMLAELVFASWLMIMGAKEVGGAVVAK